jgi:hypothetical protein
LSFKTKYPIATSAAVANSFFIVAPQTQIAFAEG